MARLNRQLNQEMQEKQSIRNHYGRVINAMKNEYEMTIEEMQRTHVQRDTEIGMYARDA